MKHLHMLMAVIAIVLFLYQAKEIVGGQKPALSTAFKGVSHLFYLLLVGSGLYLFWQIYQVAGMQHWAVAKIILLVVAVSANIKAIRPKTALPQAKAGMLVAGVAYLGIVILAFVKPVL